MCAEVKTNLVSSVSPDLNTIEQLLGELWRCIEDCSVQHWSSRQLHVALHKKWAWIPKNVVRHHMLFVRSCNETVIAAGVFGRI